MTGQSSRPWTSIFTECDKALFWLPGHPGSNPIKQRTEFSHFGSANIDSLRRASTQTLKSLRARSNYLSDKDVNKRGSTLRFSDVLFFGLVQSDLRYSKAHCQCLGMCQSSASSVCIAKFQKNHLSRLRGADVGFPAKYDGFLGKLTKALSHTVKRHSNPDCRCALSSLHQGDKIPKSAPYFAFLPTPCS